MGECYFTVTRDFVVSACSNSATITEGTSWKVQPFLLFQPPPNRQPAPSCCSLHLPAALPRTTSTTKTQPTTSNFPAKPSDKVTKIKEKRRRKANTPVLRALRLLLHLLDQAPFFLSRASFLRFYVSSFLHYSPPSATFAHYLELHLVTLVVAKHHNYHQM